ncbi:hypothetical protein RVY78_00520 [Veillonella sp. YH-vei2232]|jgi:hypothetical protein|uniref:Uncharacterized protein n=1 Tax=Veillonella absiana TaxID=3079305 RepID=A0ABU3Z7H6_9FIRM|nr:MULTISPECIES: hypothetical protein [unclassified Veillonella]MBP6923669.1 hypothetical protein [Veillonella sp.]MBP8617563.1 hypothetical protein [Veillonella sp.]MDV5062457.1 hypothetical protein [Veillonella sp. YH-vei2232]MDV5087870.1 hypothetical protein [Veillonella sp. YH-vei2233]
MSGRTFTGICIDTDCIIGVTGHIEEGVLLITDAYSMDRTTDRGHDLHRFIKQNSLDGERFGIVAQMDTQKCMVGVAKEVDFEEFLRWNLEDITGWDTKIYTYDYCLRIDDMGQKYLYVAALKTEDLDDVNIGILLSHIRVKIIDYWPSPLIYLYTHRNGFILGEVQGDSVHLYAWWKGVCIMESQVDANGPAIVASINELESHLQTYGIEEVQGVKIYGIEELAEETQYDIHAIEEEYGLMETADVQIVDRAKENFQSGDIHWDMALGLVIRGLDYVLPSR